MGETCNDCTNKCIMYEPNMRGCRNRMGECIDIYYCKIAEIPNGWQIDSVRDAEVLCDVTVFAKYYNVEV